MDVFKLWSKTVKESVNRYAKGHPKETKEDCEQECFLRILESQDVIEEILKAKGTEGAKNYVYGICHNKIVELLSPYPKSVATVSSDDPTVMKGVQDHVSEYESVLGVSEQDLDEAVKQLPRTEQHVIRSLYFHNMSERDLARSMGKTQWWVQQVKKEATVQLRTILESK